MYSYTAYGLHIHAALTLPELMPEPAKAVADVDILHDPSLAFPTVRDDVTLCVGVGPDEVRYHWPRFGTFAIRGGREIRYAPLPGTADDTVRAPLLGVVLGTLLYQRGLFTLHASAVVVDGRAVGFVGVKGAGKSTISAALNARGCPLITDDVLAVDLSIDSEGVVAPRVLPAFPHIKLWPDSVEALGEDPADLPVLHPDFPKRTRPVDGAFQCGALPLDRIYVLEDGPEIRTEQLPGREALLQLLTHSYVQRFLGSAAVDARHFQQCEAVAKQVPLIRLQRPHDLRQLDAVQAFILDDLAQPMPALP